MKKSLINGMISREWFGNGPRMDREKSRISTRLHLLTMLIVLMIGLFGVNEKAWGNSVSTKGSSDDISDNKIVLSGKHATFTISGDNSIGWNGINYTLGGVTKGKTKNFSISWTKDDDCTISVTGITFEITGYTSNALETGSLKASFNGSTKSVGNLIGGMTSFGTTNSSFSNGCKFSIKNELSGGLTSKERSFYFNNLTITYTITPNAPSVTVNPKTASVEVTLDVENPTNLGVASKFSSSDHYTSRTYIVSTNPGNAGHMNGSNFYATAADTFVVKAKYNASTGCHEASGWGEGLTITVNRLNPTLTYEDGTVDVSVNSTTDKVTLDLDDLKTAYTGNGNISYAFTDGKDHTNGSISGSTFYATEANKTYYITATSTQTGQYSSKTANFTVTVNKRTPDITWDEPEHIYASDVLTNPASASYNGNPVTLTRSYTSLNEGVMSVSGVNITANPQLVAESNCTIRVVTTATTYYESVTSEKVYLVEPKATPLFKLNGVDLPDEPIAELHLLIGETANMTFENIDQTNNRFSYPTNPERVKYTHNAGEQTGVIRGVVAGNEYIQFQQTGTNTIFGHTRSIHVFVQKHSVELSTPMGGTWKVDSIYDGTLYSISAPTGDKDSVMNEVTISSSNDKVIDFVDGHWKAVGAGTSVMTFAMKNNDYWTGDTITATITVEKYTPVITWNLESSYAWGSQISNPVSSTCELPFTLTSSDPTKADYVDGKIEVYNKNGNVTFTLTQEGNYKWNDASSNLSYTFNCFKPANHVPMDLKAGNYSHYKSYVTDNVSWNNSGVQCGTAGGGFNWDDKYIELHVTGVPYHLTFNYQTNNNVLGDPSGVEWFVQYKTETGDWGAKTAWNDNSGSKDFVLNPDVQYVRLCYSGNYGGLFTNVNITERKEIVAGTNKLTFTTAPVDASAQTLSVKVDWYNVKACNVSISGTNAEFFTLQEGSESIASAIDHFGSKTLYVKYAYPESGTHTATLHIESEDGYSANVALEATSTKLTPSIQWKENLSPMSRGENVLNAASAPVALTFSSSNESVVKVVGDTLKPLAKGTATITASFDGTSDKKWNSVSDTYDVLVTDMKVLHINWPQTFTRLKYAEGDADKTTADFELVATVSYFDPDTKEEISIDRDVTFTSNNDAVVQVLTGNILHVAGLGTTTLMAHVDGVENEYIEANVTRAVKVREPSTDCDTYILEDAHNSMLTEINSFNGVETVYDLTEEPGYLTFSAWTEKWYLGKIGIDPSGDMKVAQYIDGEWSDAIWSNSLQIGNEQPFGPFELDRRATKIKFYKEVGSTCYHNFSEGYVTLARYVELENTPKKTTLDLYFSTADAKPGVPVVKTFTVNYSNITDQLVLDYEGSDKFTVLSPNSIGEECGDKGTATVQVQFLSHEVDHYEGTLTIHNTNQSVTIHLSADVDKHTQHIDWTPETLSLNTTDDVTFDATTSGSAANLSVTYAVTAGDAATVNAATGELTIVTEGEVTIEASAAGNTSYYDAEPVSYTFHISKVTPEITIIPTAATMTLPNTNLGSCSLTGGEATVGGSFAWADNTINATLNNEGYTVVFTPENTNWFNTATCTVVVPVNLQANEITWNFNVAEMYCNANYTFDAYASSGLDVRYETSDNQVAYVDGNNHLSIIKGGEVTITAYEDGDANWAAAEPVSKTFTILRFTPEIVTLPTASSILIGQLLDNASLTDGLAELNGAPVDGGFAWVDGHSTTMNVAGEFTKDIVFNPSNANWYEPVYGTMTVVVKKYAPTIINNLTATSIEFPQTLSYSELSGSVTAMDYMKVPNEEVTGSIEWKDETTILRPGQQTGIALFVPDNTDWYTNVEIPVSVRVTGGYVFNGESNTDWTEEANWAGNLIPGTDDPVLINDDVEISTSITVGSLTIAEDVDVVVKDGGVLTIGDYDSENRETYGNLHVENGGKVICGEGHLQVNDFVLDAKLGDLDNVGKSGQVQNPATLVVNGNAYFDLALDPSGECSPGWYTFTVPFPVDVMTGITRFDNTTHVEKTIRNEVNYAIMDYSESRRVETNYGWKKYRSVMQPGKCYTMTIDDVDNVYRFKKTANGVFNTQMMQELDYTETESDRNGWNGLGNGTLAYADLSASGIEKVQVYSHNSNSYMPVNIDEYTYVVGSTFLVQAPAKEIQMNYTHSGANHTLRAPQREVESVSEFMLTLKQESDNKKVDRLYLSASEEATNTYEAGRELTKFGTPTDSKVAQVWTNAYGLQLCDIEMPLKSNKANTNLSLYAPVAGIYTLEIEKAPADATLYLTQNNRAIWNLSMSPYDFDLTKGTTEGYGLRIVAETPQISTDIENGGLLNGENGVRKVLIDNVLYIITPEGKMYDIVGKGVNF